MEKDIPMTNIYSEVYSFLQILGDEYINKIPQKLYKEFEIKRNLNYNPKYEINLENNKLDISRKALTILSALNLQYWEENEEKNSLLKKIYQNNSKILEIEKKKKYNIDIFDKTVANVTKDNTVFSENKSNALRTSKEYKIINFIKKIINKLKKFKWRS